MDKLMETNTIETANSLRIVRRYAAPRPLVFEALTDPALLSQWFAPNDDFEAYVDRFEATADGSYRIEMRHASGNIHTCVGTIQEIRPPERLVYTWSWEGGEMGETLVTWELNETEINEMNKGTELVLTHERFPNDEAAAHHTEGWTGIMGRLHVLFSRAGSVFERLFDVNTRLYRNALDDVSDERFSARLNDRTNSMQWVCGHLALTRAGMAALIGAAPDGSMKRFWTDFDPAADYPDRDAILRAWDQATERLRERLAVITWADLAKPTPPTYPGTEAAIRDALAFLAEHESYHVGQLGFLRKAHGYDAVSYD